MKILTAFGLLFLRWFCHRLHQLTHFLLELGGTLATLHGVLELGGIRGHDNLTLVVLVELGLLMAMRSGKLFLGDGLVNLIVVEKIRDATIDILML